ncbi:type II secretion system protein GspC [Aliikangiella coralliicola]|uniref:type II secretion system protein GspC n=1 Tax=Aliikangiella coralliicola TaxID=2592383 RepID=UPI00143DA83E|nr:type II secretion system protein GspC [Aliikangiella coralliicola]
MYILSKIFWVWVAYFMAPSEFGPVKVTPVASVKSGNKIDVNKLVGMELFGSVVKEAPKTEVVEQVEETKLNLKLRGIYAADSKDKANAIIEDGRGKQAVYFVNEKLEVSGRVYLRQVFMDKVILETNGRKEALTLETTELVNTVIKKSEESRKPASKKAKVEDKRSNQRISRQLNEYRNKFQSDPTSVSDVISGRPHFVNGELRGFKVSPGRDKRLFQELGLRRGDVVRSINGVALDNMQDAMSLMNDVQSIEDLNVEIERNGETLSLLLNLN